MIEFQFFLECPNADETLNNLRLVMGQLGISESFLKITVVSDIDSAKQLMFQGSPSILVNRWDIYSGKEPSEFFFGCRIYEFKGKRTGVIPKDVIRQKLVNS